jgi:Fe-S-cluster containining protein
VDRERLGARLSQVAIELDGRWFLRMTRGHCDSLTVDERAQRYLCAVYELRPDACRAFSEGSRACELIRREALVRRAR